MARQDTHQERAWFAIHTYAGYENAVERNLKQRVESLGMQDKIFNVLVPTEKVIKVKNGKRVEVDEKFYPGYILVDMIVTDDSWYVIRNTPRVTGFVGSGTVPVQTPVSSSFVVASASGLTDPGYRFSGWSDGANTYQPGDTYTVGSSPVTLTALWTPLITYSAPSPASNVQATLNGNIATVTFVPGSNGNLPTSYAIEMFVNGVLQGNVCTMAIVQSCTVSGITPNAVVTFVVVSSNDIGSATSNSSNALTYSVATTTTTTTTTTTMTTTTTVPKAPTTTGTSTQLAVDVEFPNGVSSLTVAIKKQLTKVARQITSAGVRAVWVKGYADATGPQALNQTLSLDRATNVKNFLASLCSSSVQFHVIAGGTKPGVGASYRIVEVTSK